MAEGLFTVASRVCGVCTLQYSKYKCPRCSLQYCSLSCYRKHGEACTEGFYAEHAQAELQGLRAPQEQRADMLRKLQRPRYVMVPLPEFMQKAGRDAFVANHQMPPFEKSDWKGAADFPIEKKYGYYEEAFGQTAELLPELNKALLELESLICCPDCCTEGGVSYDDIDLWARLRSLTIIKGVELPPKVRAYLDNFEAKGDVPLYDTMAV